jgi:hypothetical protein
MVISVISWHRWVVGRRADPHRYFLIMAIAVLADLKNRLFTNL